MAWLQLRGLRHVLGAPRGQEALAGGGGAGAWVGAGSGLPDTDILERAAAVAAGSECA